MDSVAIMINGKEVQAPAGSTILQAARENGIHIPTLCHFEGLEARANCRMCIVEVEGMRTFQPSCATRVREGMVINTDTEAVRNARKTVLELILADHAVDCHHCMRIGSSKCDDLDPVFCEMCFFCDCPRDGFCELQTLAREYHVDMLPYVINAERYEEDKSLGSVIRNQNKCIKCRRCVDVCGQVQTVHNLSVMNRSTDMTIIPQMNKSMADSSCVHCGRCPAVCPTGAIYMKERKDELLFYTHGYEFKTVAQLDEKVIPELEKNFKLPSGTISTMQLVSALRKIGIDYVVTDKYAKGQADAAAGKIIEEAAGTVLLTQSPAVRNFIERFYPDMKDQVTVVDSVQKTFGDYVKNVFAKEQGLDPTQIKTINITSSNEACAEAVETKCVDFALNSRELYRIFLRSGGAPHRRDGSIPDSFGRPEEMLLSDDYDFMDRDEPKRTILTVKGKQVSVAAANNLGQTRQLLEQFSKGTCDVDVLWLRA